MTIIDGKKIAEKIITDLKKEPNVKKYFAAVLVGNNDASISFLKKKEEIAKVLGINFRLYQFPENATQDFLRKEVGKIAAHKTCGGIIVQLPLPPHVNRHYVLNAIPREKDPDVMSERSLGAFYADRSTILPPVVGTTIEILKNALAENEEKKILEKLKQLTVAIVGRGFLIGQPIAIYLMNKVKNLIVLGRAGDLSLLKQADLVILGAGKANLITPDMLKQNATIIDFGYDKLEGKLTGDLNTSTIHNLKFEIHNLLRYTPTPGGTGPVLVAQLFKNFHVLTKFQKSK